MDYVLKRQDAFTRFLDDSRICLINNATERALCGIALGRKSWLFAESDRGGRRAEVLYSLIITAKMIGVDPQARLADDLARIVRIKNTKKLHKILMSEPYLEEIRGRPELAVLGEDKPFAFDADGRLLD